MIGNNDKGQTRSEFWLQKLHSIIKSAGGTAFYGKITTATSTTQFKADSLKGMGTNILNAVYYCQIIQADAVAPEGEIQKISAYDTSDGAITVDSAFTIAPEVSDYILILHESVVVPTADSTENLLTKDVIGNKSDVAAIPSSTTSIVAGLKKIYNNQAGEETISSYDLPNDTAENTAITVTTTKRLKLDSIWLDLVNLVQDVTIKVYHKIDGTTYRQYDEFSWGTSEEDGVLLRDVTINGDWKLTVTSTIAQGAIKAIPYNVIKTTMET